jgi:hypothetical protein
METKTRIVVEVAELGLDGRRDVLKLLNEATADDGIQWREERVDTEPHLGVPEIVFITVTTTLVEHVVAKVEAVIHPWCSRGLRKVFHRVRTETIEGGPDPVDSTESPDADEH